MTGIVRWEDLPPDGRHTRRISVCDHAAVAEELREHPGRWALVLAGGAANTAFASLIRSGGLPAYRPAGSFQAAFRTVADEQRVYARFVGPGGRRRPTV